MIELYKHMKNEEIEICFPLYNTLLLLNKLFTSKAKRIKTAHITFFTDLVSVFDDLSSYIELLQSPIHDFAQQVNRFCGVEL